MPEPDPRSVNVGLANDALPSAPTGPMSTSSHGGGGAEAETVTPIGGLIAVALRLSVATAVKT